MKNEQKYCVINNNNGPDPNIDPCGLTLAEAAKTALLADGRDYVIEGNPAWRIWCLRNGYYSFESGTPIFSLEKSLEEAEADIWRQCYEYSRKHGSINDVMIVTEEDYTETLRQGGLDV